MYGTVARFRVKSGAEQQLMELGRSFETLNVPGYVSQRLYRMEKEPNVYYLAVAFESKDAYEANARNPEQDARYQQIRALLEDDPEWHDGELVYSTPGK